MVRVQPLLALVLLSLGCPPPPNLCGVFPGGIRVPAAVVVSAGAPQTFDLTVNGPGCLLDPGVLTANGELRDESGRARPVTVDGLRQDLRERTVTATVGVPVLEPGRYTLRLFIEPAIALVQPLVYAAVDRRDEPGLTQPLDGPCDRPSRTTAGTVFCRDANAGQRTVFLRGDFTRPLPDVRDVLVLGDTVWMIELDRTSRAPTLVRAIDRGDAGLESVARSSENAIGTELIGVDETHAAMSGTLATFTDGGLALTGLPSLLSPCDSLIVDRDGLFAHEASRVCDLVDGGWCQDEVSSLTRAGFDRRSVWFEERSAFGAPVPGILVAFQRPLGRRANPGGTWPIPENVTVLRAQPAGCGNEGEQPVVLGPASTFSDETLVLLDGDGGLRFERFRGGTPVRASRDWLVLRPSPRSLVFHRLTP
jgi:hypothetical protein